MFVTTPAKLLSVDAVAERILYLEFADGTRGLVDLAEVVRGGPIFQAILESSELFKQVEMTEWGSVGWPNGADLDPTKLRHALHPISRASRKQTQLRQLAKTECGYLHDVVSRPVDVQSSFLIGTFGVSDDDPIAGLSYLANGIALVTDYYRKPSPDFGHSVELVDSDDLTPA